MFEVKDITYAYGKRKILSGVSFGAAPGQCVGIAGQNGCGKSTLLSILAGALAPQGGQCLINGQEAWHKRGALSRLVGYVPQENPLIEELSVLDNLRLWYGSKKAVEQAMQHGFLSVLDLRDMLRMPVKQLSGGQKKRVSIGSAMASDPPILIMDEPGAALDMVCKAQIQSYLKLYLAHRGTIIMATHEASELDLCTHLYVLCGGKLKPAAPNLRGAALLQMFG